MVKSLKRKIIAAALAFAMIFQTGVPVAFAADTSIPLGASSLETVCTHHTHNETCGYSEGTSCTFNPLDCLECNPKDSGEQGALQEHCSCKVLCTENQIDADCPVCSAEGADLTACKGEATALLKITPYAGEVYGLLKDDTGTVYATNSDGTQTDGTAMDDTGKKTVTHLFVSSGVTKIEISAFEDSTSLTTVDLSDATALQTIDQQAFIGCTNLTSVDLSKATALQTIDQQAFAQTGIASITIPESVTEINTGAFYTCTSLTEVNLSNAEKLGTIGDNAFFNCTKLTTVNLSSATTLQTIGVQAFQGTRITSITIPESVTQIGAQAFLGTGITSITIPASVTDIGGTTGWTFAGCTKLNTVTFKGETPPTIGANVFANCNALETIYVPNGSLEAYKAAANLTDYAGKITVPQESPELVISNSTRDFDNCAIKGDTLTVTKMPDWVKPSMISWYNSDFGYSNASPTLLNQTGESCAAQYNAKSYQYCTVTNPDSGETLYSNILYVSEFAAFIPAELLQVGQVIPAAAPIGIGGMAKRGYEYMVVYDDSDDNFDKYAMTDFTATWTVNRDTVVTEIEDFSAEVGGWPEDTLKPNGDSIKGKSAYMVLTVPYVPYTVTHNLENMTATPDTAGDAKAAHRVAYCTTLTANAGYALPQSIVLTIGDKIAVAGTDYTYNSQTGEITVKGDSIDGTLVISAQAVTNGSTGGGSSYDYYDIKITKEGNGTISPDGGSDSTLSVREWRDQTFTFTPDKGYVVSDVLVDGKSIGAKASYTFKDVTKDHTLKVIFKASSNGHVNPQTGVAFEDVQENNWFVDSVYHAVNNGWFSGTSETTFSPYLSTTRGMIATVLWRMENQPTGTAASIFEDVANGAYYADGVNWAQANSIVGGYGNGKFGPEDNITREQMAAILYRYAQLKGYDVSKTASLDSFTDASATADYAKAPMAWAVANGLISGKGNGLFDPCGNATRAEVAAILTRFDALFSEK